MRGIAITALAAAPLFLAACGELETTPVPLTAKQEQLLAKELKNKVAGEPKNCISGQGGSGLVRISDSKVIYKPGGGTVYVNNLRGSCPGLARDTDIIVTESFGGNLCRGDLIRLVDRTGGFPGPVCSLGEFIPYKKPKA